MGKKKLAKTTHGGVNLSQAVLEILTENRQFHARQVREELTRRHPGVTFNPASANVAFSIARRKLGIRRGRKAVRKQKPVAIGKARAPRSQTLDLSLLQAAKKSVGEVGSAEKALAAIQQIAALQIS